MSAGNILHVTSDPLLAELAQQALHAQGLYEGAIDGIWGPKTELAFDVYFNYNRYAGISKLTLTLSADQQADIAKFLKTWKNLDASHRYYAVARACDVPAELVAALHWRESGGDFTTYLQNGDPLGAPTVHEPYGLLFHDWTTAAIDAIQRETTARAQSGIEGWTTDAACLCIFAEYYNGAGYRNRGVPDPYVLAGTSGYVKGKYVADGEYDPEAVDQQVGILPLLRALAPQA